MQLHIDADILVYRCGFASQDDPESYALHSLDCMVQDILIEYPEVPYQLYLTGKGNFRFDIAKTHPYKGTRSKKEKPIHYAAIRQHLIDYWKAEVVEGQEADDAIAQGQHASGYKDVIVTIDKDLNGVPGKHYNFVKRLEYDITAEEATRFFYSQILTGDTVDNIIGLKGIGPKKAEKILEDCTTEREMYEACVAAYEKFEEPHPEARVCENAQLLYMRVEEDKPWEIP